MPYLGQAGTSRQPNGLILTSDGGLVKESEDPSANGRKVEHLGVLQGVGGYQRGCLKLSRPSS